MLFKQSFLRRPLTFQYKTLLTATVFTQNSNSSTYLLDKVKIKHIRNYINIITLGPALKQYYSRFYTDIKSLSLSVHAEGL
jgi:hypothetical protein